MKQTLVLFILILFSTASNAQEAMNQTMLKDKIDALINEMTLEEKASLCSGRDDWSTQPIERLDIPWIWMADGPHGLRRSPATNKPGYGDQLPATCFPTASALAATWDLDLIREVGEYLGKECQAMNVNVLLGPGVNIKRSVLGGRNFEYYSEDPLLSGEMGAAFINGVQSQGVGTSLKHFTANNVETARMYNDSDVDTRTLHEIYLRPFEIAVKKAHPWTIMACYNRVQGEYGTQNPYLLQKVLEEDWGYEGVVISDWFAVVDKVEAVKAGLNIEMPHVSDFNDQLLVDAVRNGKLDEAVIDDLLRSILSMVFKAKSLEKEGADFDREAHHQFARQVAAESATLLKNEDTILPVNADKYKKIAVIGEFAAAPRFQGNGSSEVKPTRLDKVLDVLENEFGSEYKIEYAQGYNLKDDDDFSMIEEAAKLAKSADIALVFAGLPLHYESEGIDRTHIDMPMAHNKLIEQVAKNQENTVVVLTNGSAVTMPWLEQVKGVLECWLGGQAGAGGSVDVLFGKVNPSGKLAETFPQKLEDTPAFFNFPGEQGEVLYGERIFVGYRYYDEKNIEPMFPFGFGLSYTTFEYSNLEVSKEAFTDQEGVRVSVTVKNTGQVKGKEVVQLYVTDPESKLQRPKMELKAFEKLALEPGEEKTITFKLDDRAFAYFDAKRDHWIAESGLFEIGIGASSRDIRLKGTVTLQSTQQIPLGFDEYTFFREYWDFLPTRQYLKEYMPNWIGQFVPEGKSMDEARFNGFLIDHPLIKYPYITGGEISKEQVDELVRKCRNMTFAP